MKQTPPNTDKMENNMFEEKHEEKKDNDAEERVGAPLEDESPVTRGDQLVEGLDEDVVLGEVVRRLPWCNLPVLMTLNRTWADALTHRFPQYASHHRRILNNSIVIYRHGILDLWVYNYHRVLWRLPVPELLGRYLFVLDDDYDRIFAFARTEVYRKDIYNISMLDLNEGSSTCSWEYLPNLEIKFPDPPQKYPYSCSSFRTENGIHIKLIMRCWNHDTIEPRCFSVWTLDGKKKFEWGKWQNQPVTESLIQSFYDAEENTPFYVEIEVNRPVRGHSMYVKYLYQRVEPRMYTVECRYSYATPEYIFMVQNEERGSKQSIMDFEIYHIRVKETHNRSQLSFHRAKLNDESKRFLDADGFEQFWLSLFPDMEKGSLMKIVSNGYSGKKGIHGIPWDKKCFKIGPGGGLGGEYYDGGLHYGRYYDDRKNINIKLARKGRSLYIYKFVKEVYQFVEESNSVV